jgi:hypothetical protein
MEAPHNNHLYRYPHQYKSSKETWSSNRSNCKTGTKKPLKTRLLKRSCSESSRRLRGSIKNRNPSRGDKQRPNVLKPGGNI